MRDELMSSDTWAIWLYFNSQEIHFKINVKLCSEWNRDHSSRIFKHS